MRYTYVQSAIDTTESYVTLPNPVTQGNLIVVGLTNYYTTTIPANAITDNKGNTYTKVNEANNSNDRAALFYAKNVTGGSSFTVYNDAGGTFSVHEYSSVATTSPLDQTNKKTGTGATVSSNSVTTTLAGELYVGVAWSMGHNDTWTAGPGWTKRQEERANDVVERHASEDRVISIATTTAATFTTSSSDAYAAVIATFKPATTQGGGGGAPALHIIHTDHLGGTNVVSDANGTLEQTLSYYPFGSTRIDAKAGTFNERNKFTGHKFDDATGLYYMNARYQEPRIGRFVSEDPSFLDIGRPDFKQLYNQPLALFLATPQNLNSYSYVDNNPVTMRDPDGREGEYFWQNMNWLNQQTNGWFGNRLQAEFEGQQEAAKTAADMTPAGNVSVLTTGKWLSGQSASTFDKVLSVAALTSFTPETSLVGQSFGKLGIVIENTPGKITGFTGHGLDQVATRAVTAQTLLDTTRNAVVTLRQAGGNVLYLTNKAGVVLNKVGQVVTSYSSKEFKPQVLNVLRKATGR